MDKSIKDLIITQRQIEKTSLYTLPNKQIAKYYDELADASFDVKQESRYRQKAFELKNCNNHWLLDFYSYLNIKDKKGSMSCKNKFCLNCQTKILATRRKRFTPELEKIAEKYDIYHLTLTFPNIVVKTSVGESIKNAYSAIENMPKAFKKLVRYLSGNVKIHGIDFTQYGYAGALRSLEFVARGLELHPHYHCLVALKKGLEFKQHIYNRFSRSRKDNEIYYYSDFEILIQKIWRLLIDGEVVTAANIEKLKDGYSCQFKKVAPGEYGEIFKYVTKPNDMGYVYDFFIFMILEQSLYKRRIIQGSGVFYNIKPDDSIDDQANNIYDNLIKELQKKDKPVAITESLDQILLNKIIGNCLYIDRSVINSWVRDLMEDNKLNISTVFEKKEKLEVVKSPVENLSPQQISIIEYLKQISEKNN